MEPPDVPAALDRARQHGLHWHARGHDVTTWRTSRCSRTTTRLGMTEWRDKLFIFLSRNARRATNFFQIPPDRVVEHRHPAGACDAGRR